MSIFTICFMIVSHTGIDVTPKEFRLSNVVIYIIA